jgi:hypothetical protein
MGQQAISLPRQLEGSPVAIKRSVTSECVYVHWGSIIAYMLLLLLLWLLLMLLLFLRALFSTACFSILLRASLRAYSFQAVDSEVHASAD